MFPCSPKPQGDPHQCQNRYEATCKAAKRSGRRKRLRAKHSLKTVHTAMTNTKLQAVLQPRSYMKTNE